jgi:hypothetical protein
MWPDERALRANVNSVKWLNERPARQLTESVEMRYMHKTLTHRALLLAAGRRSR